MDSRATLEDELRGALSGSAGAGIAAVYVFGSVAEQREHRDSDLDIGVLFDFTTHPTRAARFEARLKLSADLSTALGRQLDVVVLNDAPPLLGRHVVTRGRPAMVAAPEVAHAFVRDVQLRAADILPFLRRTRAVKLGTLRG
jgi:predicted nucleotidyltransferase